MTSDWGPGSAGPITEVGAIESSMASRELDQLFLLHAAALQTGEAVAGWWFRWRASAQDATTDASLREVLRDSLGGIARALSADAVAVLLADENSELVVRAAIGMQPELMREVHISSGAGMAGQVMAERRALLVKDLSTVEVSSETLRNSGVRSLVAVPIFAGDQVIGVLHADSRQLAYFDERHAALLALVADRLGAAVEQVRLFDAERAARADAEVLAGRLGRLQRVTAALSQELDARQIGQAVLTELSDDIGTEAATHLIWVVEDAKLRLLTAADGRQVVSAYAEMALDDPLPGPMVARAGEPLWFSSPAELKEFEELEQAEVKAEALAVLPLIVESQVIGVMAVAYGEQRVFSEGEKFYLAVAARLVAEALHRARVRQDRIRAVFANTLLADVSAALGTSLDSTTSLRRALVEVVPRLADLAVVHLVDESGVPRRAALVHRHPATESTLIQAAENAPHETRSVLATMAAARGRPLLLPAGDRFVEEAALDEAHARRLRELGITSAVAVPLGARGQHGILGLMRLGASAPYTADDLELAGEIGARTSNAIDNAVQHQRRVAVARALQESLLPPALPEVPGAEVAAVFHAASAGAEVGGDFYDLFPVDDRRWVLMIGDVSGSGPAAAAVTAQVRHGARVAARAGLAPAAVVAAVNATLEETTGSEWFCTMVYAELIPHVSGIDLQVICAGHLAPLVMAGGRVDELHCQAPLLGVLPGATFPAERLHLAPGQAMVLVTDGATEARPADDRGPDAFFGEERLHQALSAAPAGDAENLVLAVADAVLEYTGGQLHDDLALVAVRAAPATVAQNRGQ